MTKDRAPGLSYQGSDEELLGMLEAMVIMKELTRSCWKLSQTLDPAGV